MTTHISGSTYALPSSLGAFTLAQWTGWVNSIIDAFVAVGLVQTTDTGQADPGVLPSFAVGTNGEVGYLMFRFNDTEQATDPIFIRVKFARGNNTGVASQGYSIGTGTNGAGVLTGAFTPVYDMCNNSYWAGTNSTYACFSNNAFFLGNGYNANGYRTFQSWIAVERNRNPTTAVLEAGFNMAFGGISATITGQLNTVGIRSASPAQAFTAHRSCMLTPTLPSNPVLLNGDKIIYPHFFNQPEVRPRWSTATVRAADFGTTLSTFSATLIPGFTRTYAQFGSVRVGRPLAHNADNTTYCLAAVWE